ncbi:MAG: hypothetical protein QNJ15_15130, partial [Erythrobacter sp.]|nr:hypothetical protein [Erythrobacter sp.]
MRFIWGIFGALGLAISCVEGIEPFVEVTQWIAWFARNWIELTQAFWTFLFDLVGIRIPVMVADALSGIAYTVALIVSFFRFNLSERSWLIRLARWWNSLINKTRDRLRDSFIKHPVDLAMCMIFVSPFVIICTLLWNGSPPQALALFCTALLVSLLMELVTGKRSKVLERLILGDGNFPHEKISLSLVISPVFVFALLAAI